MTRRQLLQTPRCVEEVAVRGSVALLFRDPLTLAWALVGLDGRANRILLLPPDLQASLRHSLLQQANVQVVLTDDGNAELPEGVRAVRWSGDGLGIPAPLPADGATEWVVATSGTTGSPKLVVHDLTSLTRLTSRSVDHEDRYRWGQLYDICRFAGLQVFLQATISGSLLILPDLGDPVDRQVDFLVNHGCTALSATPTLWRKLLMSPSVGRLPLRQVTLGGEVADARILSALREKFPTARVVHIYASTEAGAAFSVRDGLPGFPAEYLDHPPKGVRLKIEDGILHIQNGRDRMTYLGDNAPLAKDGWVNTGDLIGVENGRCLFRGRATGSINVGGNKVMPEEIEAVLLEHPSVQFARVTAKPSPITGSLVVAEVVAADTGRTKDLGRLLRQHCSERLAGWKVPAIIKVVEELDLTQAGKLERQ